MKSEKLWFRAKRYGWGWYPVSWEGWGVVALYTVAVLKGAWSLVPSGSFRVDFWNAVACVAAPTIFLVVICLIKGERPKWRWGDKAED